MMRLRPDLLVVFAVVAATITMFALLRFSDWERTTVVGVSSLVIVIPLLINSQLVLGRKRARSEELMREIVSEGREVELERKDGP